MKYRCLLLLCCILFCSCKAGLDEFFWRRSDVSSRSTIITDIAVPESISNKTSFSVLLLADLHFSDVTATPKSILYTWLDSLEESEIPDFCIILGDMTNYGLDNEYSIYRSFAEELGKRGIRIYGIPGNHDIYNSGWNEWMSSVNPGTAYYRFNTALYSWYFLDTANGTLGEAQFNSLVDELKDDPKRKIVFSHYPLYQDGVFYFSLLDSRERAKLIAAFADNNVYYYIAGHKHDGGCFDYGSFYELGLKAFVNRKIEGYYKNNGYWSVLTIDELSDSVSCNEYSAEDLSVFSLFSVPAQSAVPR